MGERVELSSKKQEVSGDNNFHHKHKNDFQLKSSDADKIMLLQRTIGNQAVGKLFQSGVYHIISNSLNTTQISREIEDKGTVSLCDRDFAGKLGKYVPARHCFVWFHPPGTNTTPASIDPEQTSTYDNKVSGTPDSEPNKSGRICRATYSVDPACVRQKYVELCSPSSYDLAKFNCCTCALQALTACGASPMASDFPPENHGTGLPDSFGKGWKKRLLNKIL